MLKLPITYETFDGEEVTDVFYFNISKPELIELEVGMDQRFTKFMARIVETKDDGELIKQFKRLILMSYGVKSDDGKKFVKSDELRADFEQTAAYQHLFMEIASNDLKALEFLRGILPKDISEEAIKELEEESKKQLESAPAKG